MLRFELLKKVVQGDAIAFVLSALGCTAIDCGLGCRLLFGARRFVRLGLRGFTCCVSADLAQVISSPYSGGQGQRQQRGGDECAHHAQLPLPQLL